MRAQYVGALVGVLITWSACTVAHYYTRARPVPAPRAVGLDLDRLCHTIEYLESSHKNHPLYKDGKEWAFGLYGMHLDRWEEIG